MKNLLALNVDEALAFSTWLVLCARVQNIPKAVAQKIKG